VASSAGLLSPKAIAQVNEQRDSSKRTVRVIFTIKWDP
jgi:hypothetical protein